MGGTEKPESKAIKTMELMKKLLYILMLSTTATFSQTLEEEQPKQNNEGNLKKLTIGLGAGYNWLSEDIFDYSLSTDSIGVLQTQELSNRNFVLSSVVVFRLGDPKVETSGTSFMEKTGDNKVLFKDRISLNLSINLLDISSDNVTFNKLIDGGLGIGVFINSYAQIGVFYEISRYRQMRDYVVDSYSGKPIPKGNDYYNALDPNDNQLFYNATTSSFSIKAIFVIPNKEEQQ